MPPALRTPKWNPRSVRNPIELALGLGREDSRCRVRRGEEDRYYMQMCGHRIKRSSKKRLASFKCGFSFVVQTGIIGICDAGGLYAQTKSTAKRRQPIAIFLLTADTSHIVYATYLGGAGPKKLVAW
jgi:hypothetical protein